jgi:hypothetical protein
MSPSAGSGIFFLAFGGFCVAVTIIGTRRREKTGGLGRVPPPDPVHAREIAALPDEDYELVLKCGAWANGINVTAPYASFLINPRQAELRVWSVIEPIRIARGEVTGVRRVLGPFTWGLKFRTESGRLDKVTVWPGWKAGAKLRELGWP